MEYVMLLLMFMGWVEPRCEFVAVTYDGNEYVVGSGRTCKDAMVGWRMPDNWRSIERQEGWAYRSL